MRWIPALQCKVLHVSSRCTAASITSCRNAHHFNVSHHIKEKRVIHNRYLLCQDAVHHSVWALSDVSFPPLHVSEMDPVLWRFLPRPWGGINTNEMAERETLALWLSMQVNEQACRGRSVLSEGTHWFSANELWARFTLKYTRRGLYWIKSFTCDAAPSTLQVRAVAVQRKFARKE